MAAEGAARRSLSERYNVKVETQTGGAACTLPIQTTAGRSDFGPSLSLEYGSGAAATNGIFGMGWHLAGVESISRKTTAAIPKYDESDTFVHSGLGDLVPLDQPEKVLGGYRVREYRARVESSPVCVQQWTEKDGGETFWRTISAANVTAVYGRDGDSQISFSGLGQAKRVFCWLAVESYDSHGNSIRYRYKAEDSAGIDDGRDVFESHRRNAVPSPQRYLKSILYGNTTPCRHLEKWDMLVSPSAWLFEVVFDYGEHNDEQPTTREDGPWALRPDPFSTYSSAFEIRTYRSCRRVLMFHHFPSPAELGRQDCLVASACFEYQADPCSGGLYLQSCVQRGHSPKGVVGYWTLALPPVELSYTALPSLADLAVEELDLRMTGVTTSAAQWVDLDGDGAPGVLVKIDGTGWYYQRNLTTVDGRPQVGDPRPVEETPNVAHTSDSSSDWNFEDVRGDGLSDVVVTAKDGTLRGFYEREEDGGWVNFVPFETYPIIDNPEATRRVDLRGSGCADILHLETRTWHPSRGPGGFDASQATVGAPLLALKDERSLVQLCDMTGDGLADIVRISNGSICYWPNTGHGTFGAKVTMGNAPWMASDDVFSPQFIRTGDFSGSGTTDMVYLQPKGGAIVYYNRCGNDWSEGNPVPCFPSLDQVSAVDVLDLAGQGTACLCWMSDIYSNGSSGLGTVRFVDLMGKRRPGVLKKWSNGIGCETEFTYRSSFLFRREDESKGNPWSTRLPFPLQCVDRVVTVDHVARTSHTTRYAYHNGHYDYAERQFRGFQMVESWDAELFDIASATQFQRPPVLTRQWYYVGLPKVDEAKLPWTYEMNAPRHAAMAGPVIPIGLSYAATEEAYRALAGQGRRTEVYSVDPTDERAALPYTVSQQTHAVFFIQQHPRIASRVNSREVVTGNYERASAPDAAGHLQLLYEDARVEQHLVLETDIYGNVLLEASVQYGKASSDLPDADDRKMQEKTIITYTENLYTNVVKSDDYFQSPLLSETRRYRVLSKPHCTDRYIWVDMAKDRASFLRVPTEFSIEFDHDEDTKLGDDSRGYRVLLGRNCNLYTEGELQKPLDPGVLQQFSILYQSYELAFTSGSLETRLSAPVASKALKQSGYVELVENSGVWWVPSSRPLFGGDNPDDRMDAARRQFYIPNAEVDPFGNVSTTVYDDYHLLVKCTTNPVGSKTTSINDYARLLPVIVTDANDNRTQTSIDPLGRVIGVAIMGKEQGSTGDSLDAFEPEIDGKTMEAFFDDPSGPIGRSLLSKATNRKIYNSHAYHHASSVVAGPAAPTWVAELTRHDFSHEDSNAASQISVHISFLDGAGNVIQTASLSHGVERANEVAWDISGWVINDNKGQPVQAFQPFRAPSHAFQHQSDSSGQTLRRLTTTYLRDPMDRVVAVMNADHTWSKTRFTPWTRVDYDAGDTIMIEDPANDPDVGSYFRRLDRSLYYPTWYGKRTTDMSSREDKRLAPRSLVYADSPTIAHLDTLGRELVSETGKKEDRRLCHKHYNLRGQCVRVQDSLNRVVETAGYDFLGRLVESKNMDRGQRRMLLAADALPVLSWSDRGNRRRIDYDELRRVKNVWMLPRGSSAEILVTKYIYGETSPDAARNNLHGQLHECYDQSGRRTNASFDVLGLCLRSMLRHATEFKKSIDWTVIKDEMLEPREYTTIVHYNALRLPVESVSAELGAVHRKYDVAGRLKSLQSFHTDQKTVTSSVDNIEYAADGQIDRILYGNGTVTANTYEEDTRRLITTRTTRRRGVQRGSANQFEEQAARPIRNFARRGSGVSEELENVAYTYDCLGKVVRTKDTGSAAPDAHPASAPPTREFRYDCFGQLVQATGRIQVDPDTKQLKPYSFNTHTPKSLEESGRVAIPYTENYTYDKVGNIETMEILPSSGYTGWTRRYTYREQSCIRPDEFGNRLTCTKVGGKAAADYYKYDDDAGRHGCMTSIPGYSCLSWDFDDRLRSFSTQRVDATPDSSPDSPLYGSPGKPRAATPETTWYVYDADGARVRKVTERFTAGDSNPMRSKDTRYLLMGDVYTTYQGDGVTESRVIKTLSVSDDALGGSPVASVEVSSLTSRPLARYRVSELLELDSEGSIISYQEYSPYGSTTYAGGTMEASRVYRFASYRWDSESGLYACGARYYACWLGRWTSADPWGTVDGLNLFVYCGNDPVNCHDPGGTSDWEKPLAKKGGANKDTGEKKDTGPKKDNTPTSSTNNDKKEIATPTVTSNRPPHQTEEGKYNELTHIRLYRGTDYSRALQFAEQHDVGAVTTRVTGDFNHIGGTASYWTPNRDAALKHTQYATDPALLWVDVPRTDAMASNVKNYPMNPNEQQRKVWAEVSIHVSPFSFPLPQY